MGVDNRAYPPLQCQWPTITWSERLQRLCDQGISLPPIFIERDDEGYVYADVQHKRDLDFYLEFFPGLFDEAVLIFAGRQGVTFQLGRSH